MHTHGTCLLGDTCYRHLYVLAGGHDKVTELIDHNNYVGQVTVSLLGVELAVLEEVVVLNYGTYVGVLEQLITVVHLYAEGLEGVYYLGGVCYDCIGFIGHLGQEVLDYGGVDAELNHLGVNHDELELRRVFLVEQ